MFIVIVIITFKSELYRLSNAQQTEQSRYHIVVDQEQEHDEKEAIRFGVDILQCLRYNEKATFDCLKDEVLKNKNSAIDIKLWQYFKAECLLKCNNSNTNFELLNLLDLMALKLYSDTTYFQSVLRDC
eukprot:TRINITY_DN23623_c0_g1_i1.p1 TRINITY_DN23623_c0_g1~~TRINITY_DN23623_c0_g1_i1.p1  ORF type:complete len:128 (-),score=12.19 TRINITY_DN23623_c0_g1_i1:10-393(-)